MNIPVLRRSVRDATGKVCTSPTLASQHNQMATWNRRLGRSFGMKEPLGPLAVEMIGGQGTDDFVLLSLVLAERIPELSELPHNPRLHSTPTCYHLWNQNRKTALRFLW
jgi:hypothetical protein